MVKHLEIMNDSGNIVVDENYSVPMLIMKGRVNCATYGNPSVSPPRYITNQYFIDSYSWYGFTELFSSTNLADFGSLFEGLTPADDDAISAVIGKFNSGHIVVGRCVSGGYAIIPSGALSWDKYNKLCKFVVTAYCELENGIVDVAVYKTNDIKPSKYGMVIQNAQGDLLYDVMKPPMMFLGNMRGELNVWQYEAGRFEMTIPDGISQEDCYITRMSGTPFYSAYNIHSGGVSWGSTGFKSVMSFPTPTTLRVQVVRVNDFQGSNSAFGYGGFFENVVYCPYPFGLYLDPKLL